MLASQKVCSSLVNLSLTVCVFLWIVCVYVSVKSHVFPLSCKAISSQIIENSVVSRDKKCNSVFTCVESSVTCVFACSSLSWKLHQGETTAYPFQAYWRVSVTRSVKSAGFLLIYPQIFLLFISAITSGVFLNASPLSILFPFSHLTVIAHSIIYYVAR